MNKGMKVYVALAALLAAVDAGYLNMFPRATVASDYAIDGFSPKPTEIAHLPLHQALYRRDGSSVTTITASYAPDNTCGYIDGDQSSVWGCETSSSCVFASIASSSGRVLCCSSSCIATAITCYDYDAYHANSCNNECQNDARVLKCTDANYPYCFTASFPGSLGFFDYFCTNTSSDGYNTMLYSYSGERARSFSVTTATITNNVTTTTTSSTSSTTTSPPATTTPPPPSPSSNTGAIVGGVVGGVAGLGMLGAAIFYFLRRKRNKAAAQREAVAQAPSIYQTPGMSQTPNSQYDPKFGATAGQYPQGYHQTSPPGQTVSTMDPRWSVAASSTSPELLGDYAAPGAAGYPPQENIIHEAPAQSAENHRGEMHELA